VQGRIAGHVMLETRSLGRAPARAPRPLEGVGLRLVRDGQSTRVMTGTDGRFSAEGLAAGRYDAVLELPEGVYADGWPRQIEVRDARSCAELHVAAFADGRVSGRVVDAAGRPIRGLTIELTIPAGLDEPAGPERIRDLTDGDGRYELARIPAGRFVVGINTQPRQGGEPEPRLFHPGVAALTAATRVPLRAGERVTLGDFQLPRELVYVALSGVVLDAGGVPAADARVYLKGQAEADYILSEPAITDSSGRFVLAGLAGRGYRIFAERPRGGGPGAGTDSSELAAFTANAAAAPFRLVLRRRY
jgi:5-hydroxyisourate hydrolase-like protein (transthyretin family)